MVANKLNTIIPEKTTKYGSYFLVDYYDKKLCYIDNKLNPLIDENDYDPEQRQDGDISSEYLVCDTGTGQTTELFSGEFVIDMTASKNISAVTLADSATGNHVLKAMPFQDYELKNVCDSKANTISGLHILDGNLFYLVCDEEGYFNHYYYDLDSCKFTKINMNLDKSILILIDSESTDNFLGLISYDYDPVTAISNEAKGMWIYKEDFYNNGMEDYHIYNEIA